MTISLCALRWMRVFDDEKGRRIFWQHHVMLWTEALNCMVLILILICQLLSIYCRMKALSMTMSLQKMSILFWDTILTAQYWCSLSLHLFLWCPIFKLFPHCVQWLGYQTELQWLWFSTACVLPTILNLLFAVSRCHELVSVPLTIFEKDSALVETSLANFVVHLCHRSFWLVSCLH